MDVNDQGVHGLSMLRGELRHEQDILGKPFDHVDFLIGVKF